MPRDTGSRQRRASETRARLLHIAAMHFAREGFEAMSIAPLLGEAGIARGGFYHHFASKRDLFREVVTAVERGFDVSAAERARELFGTDPWHQLNEMAWFTVKWVALNKLGIARVVVVDAPHVLRFEERAEVGRVPILRDAIELALGTVDGDAAAIPPLTRQLLALTDECVRLLMEADDVAATRELLRRLLTSWLTGLREALAAEQDRDSPLTLRAEDDAW